MMKKAFHLLKFFPSKSINNSVCLNVKCLSNKIQPTARSKSFRIQKEYTFIRHDLLPSIINNRQTATTEEWKNIRNEIFNSATEITTKNIDTLIINYCLQERNYLLGYNYYNFLKKENLKPNLATIGKYFRLFYYSRCNQIISEEEELDILKLYDELRKTYQLFDCMTCENAIHALSLTSKWNECLKLLEEIKISSSPSSSSYSVVIAAAFKNGNTELGWQLLNDVINESNRPLLPISYIAYLELCDRSSSNAEYLQMTEKLFTFLRENDVKCDNEVIDYIKKSHEKFELSAKVVRINARGHCLSCNEKLEKFEPSANEFEDLKNSVMKNVIVGKNVFYKTSPNELKHFQEFIANMKQYDVVIDGLNVAYCAGTKQSPQVYSTLLAAVVKHFAGRNKRILVLGRTHMQKWPRRNWGYITERADTFLAENISQDDPYLLYCALNSGFNTIIVTRDLMRSHVFRLKEPRLKILFNQWLTQNQYQLLYVDNRGRVNFKYPPTFIKTPQKHRIGWHIPLISTDDSNEDRWLCLER